MATGEDSFEVRQSVVNTAEVRFREWCERERWKCFRMGFDEKDDFVPEFWRLHEQIRHTPDFLVAKEAGEYYEGRPMAYIQVKGTLKLKKNEVGIYYRWGELFATNDIPLVVAFMLREKSYFLRPSEILDLMKFALKGEWPDGKVYHELLGQSLEQPQFAQI